tara:strand:+ start:2048 stop:2308 length:261 start_codon:yes stop_codon:yes gene_type:complete
MKKKFTLTLDGSDEFLLVSNIKERILNVVPKGKKTTSRIIANGLNIHERYSLKSLTRLEEAGYFSSELTPVKYKKTTCVARVFKRL